MANKNLFRSFFGRRLPATTGRNDAGGVAYLFDPRHALAQYATTGCLNGTFYASAENQLDAVLGLCDEVKPEFIARTAVFARRRGGMKDLPALLLAVLSIRDPLLFGIVFDRVVDSLRMLRTFVQIVRSGAVGRKSLGSLPKRLVRDWLDARSDDALFIGSVGNDPSLRDIVRMVHPRPATPARSALLAYLVGRPHDAAALPPLVREFEAFRQAGNRQSLATPDVPFQMLASLDLSTAEWTAIARHATWQTTRMNLATFERHGVFADGRMVRLVAARLRDPALIRAARPFPYQLLTACKAAAGLPTVIVDALQDALEIAVENVPPVTGRTYVLADVSGSMHSPVTGHRRGASTACRCIDVAALVAAALMRRNPQTEVVPFSDDVVPCRLNPRDSVVTNAEKLAALPSGGTDCAAPLEWLNRHWMMGDLVVYVSDNESWIDGAGGGHRPTRTLEAWSVFTRRNPGARMVCIDIQPNRTTQAPEADGITNVGGFSDQVFDVIAAVAEGRAARDHVVREIEGLAL